MLRSPPARTNISARAGGLRVTSSGFNRWSYKLQNSKLAAPLSLAAVGMTRLLRSDPFAAY
jgi:hypothetical protein